MANHELYQEEGLVVGKDVVRVNLRWPEFKKYINGTYKKLLPQYVDDGSIMQIFAREGNILYTTAFVTDVTEFSGTFDTAEKQNEHSTQRQEFESNWKNQSNREEPKSSDGKPIITVYPAREGTQTWFTGRGDTLSPPERGMGQKIRLSWDAVEARGAKSASLNFIEPVEIHDGQGIIKPPENWGLDDTINLYVSFPATVVVANTSSLGNSTLVPTGLGYNVVIPMVSGTHDVDLAAAVPIPASSRTGYWDVDSTTGIISTASEPGAGGFHLIDVPGPNAYLLNEIPLGQPTGIFDVDVYKSEWVHNNWNVIVEVDKQSSGSGDFAGWLLMFRRSNIR